MKNVRLVIEVKGKKPLEANIELPEAWHEVPADLYPQLASLYLATDKEMSAYDKTVRAFTLLTWKHYKVVSQLTDEELYDMLPLTNWVFDTLDLVKNIQPQIKAGKTILYGPDDGMDNLRFAEWCAAATYLTNYTESEDIADLHLLVACIYRPAGEGPEYIPGSASYRGDARQKFNDQLVEERAKLIAQLPVPVIQGVYIWFRSCLKQITLQYPSIFPEKENDEAEKLQSGTAGDGWLGVYDDLRGDPKYGGAEKLEEEFLNMVFFSLNRNNEKMKELKAKHNL